LRNSLLFIVVGDLVWDGPDLTALRHAFRGTKGIVRRITLKRQVLTAAP
jgi:hypothetical protein